VADEYGPSAACFKQAHERAGLQSFGCSFAASGFNVWPMRTRIARTDADTAEKPELFVGEWQLTDRVLKAFYEAFGVVRFGLPEQMCANALAIELEALGLHIEREMRIEVFHRGVSIGWFRVDMVVEDKVVLEIKSAESIQTSDEAQLLNYLRVTKYEVGFLLLFGIRPRFRRLVYSNHFK